MQCGYYSRRLLVWRSARRFASKLPRWNDANKLVDLSQFTPDKLRNFCIVAHVDHGKSTLADRLLELTGVVDHVHEEQLLDKLQVERERGITVKAQTCTMLYKGHLLNLIDTPGHADFNFEVSRSLAVSDGTLLLIAANQGVQAQTIAAFWAALENDVSIIPVINKVDVQHVDVAQVEKQLLDVFGFEKEHVLRISAKTGLNMTSVLDAVIDRLSPPSVNRDLPFQGLVYDSWFDKYRGVIACVLLSQGSLSRGDVINSYNSKRQYQVTDVGIMHPGMVQVQSLYAGQVGYVVANMKTVNEVAAGETLYMGEPPQHIDPLPGFTPAKPTVFAGLFPMDANEYERLKQAIDELSLNDPSVAIQSASSAALGLGWRVGFLGVLHMEVFRSRLEQEYGTEVLLTPATVQFRAMIKPNESIRKRRYAGQAQVDFTEPSQFPERTDVEEFLEPMVKLRVVVNTERMAQVNALCVGARGTRGITETIDHSRVALYWRLPLAEVLLNFFDRLNTITSGYVSFDYDPDGYQKVDLVQLNIYVNGSLINEFSLVCPLTKARPRANAIIHRLKQEIPRQQYEVVLKASLGTSSKAIAHTVISPLKKDFSQLLKGNFGGGGMERLNKKLSHQNKGKLRMKTIGRVNIPKHAFINVLKT